MPPPASLHGLCRVTDRLYISNARAAADAAALARHNITCVINVSEGETSACSAAAASVAAEDYVHIPVADSPLTPLRDHFNRVADKIDAVGRGGEGGGGGRTLVHCNAGVSRSATLCIAYLMKHQDRTLREAHAWLRRCRPMARPNNGFWRQLIAYEAELRGCASVRMISSDLGEIPDVYEEATRNMLPF
ncbi:unnamed protein product [Merluccius merluccius]